MNATLLYRIASVLLIVFSGLVAACVGGAACLVRLAP